MEVYIPLRSRVRCREHRQCTCGTRFKGLFACPGSSVYTAIHNQLGVSTVQEHFEVPDESGQFLTGRGWGGYVVTSNHVGPLVEIR